MQKDVGKSVNNENKLAITSQVSKMVAIHHVVDGRGNNLQGTKLPGSELARVEL